MTDDSDAAHSRGPESEPVTIEGTWDVVIATPIGRQNADLTFTRHGDELRGVATGGGPEDIPLRDLTLDGNRLTWAQSITRPMRLNLVFDVTVSGDEMTGTSKAGRLPTSTVTGRRATHVEHS